MNRKNKEHSFSIEMKSEHAVKRMSFFGKENDRVFFEGYLGELRNVSMVEDLMLEIEGDHGILRLDITSQEIEEYFTKKKSSGGEQ